jgi:2-(1,2-epoxy-1,2-dihydrophenyl)acetyl-CoA isomerase
MSRSTLQEETIDGVRLIRLNRPEKMNGITPQLSVELAEALEEAQQDANVRVIGLTGNGKAFCAGADLGGKGDFSQDKLDDFTWAGRILYATRVTGDKPVITGINGLAMGAGVSFAMLGDIRMASSKATFSPGYCRVATSPDGGVTWTLPQAIGHEQAMRFFLEGETLSAEDALKIGMIGEVVKAEKFEESFISYCKKIAKNSEYTLRQTKRLIIKSELSHDIASLVQDELRYVSRGLRSDDAKEAIKKLFSKGK